MPYKTTRLVAMDDRYYPAGELIEFDEFTGAAKAQLLALEPPAIVWIAAPEPEPVDDKKG